MDISQRDTADAKINRLLARLEPEDYDALIREAKVVFLKFRKRLYRQDETIDAVYFPLSCMVSIIVGADRRPRIEIGIIGKEGVVGAMELTDTEGAMGAKLVQLPGTAVRIDAGAFRKLKSSRPRLRDVIDQYLHALMRQIVYAAACSQLHSMEQRCARWLLVTHDNACADTFPLTQDFLSHMLGVRRATVNVATGMLRRAGFIEYVHGKMTVVDRPGLESVVCECYQAGITAYNSSFPGALRQDAIRDLQPAPARNAKVPPGGSTGFARRTH